MINVSVVNYKDCFSCRSCFLSCPKNAIAMIENEEGFFFPKVTEDKCIDCGICVKKCPSLNKVERENFEQYGLAVIAKDNDTLLKSSSGAASSVIANKIVTDGDTLRRRIVARNRNNLITIDNEYIPISVIRDIYK